MLKKFMLICAVVCAAAVFVATPAGAQDGPDNGDTYVASDTDANVNDDGSVTITGENCPPGGPVTFAVVSRSGQNSGQQVDSGETTADADGSFAFTTDPLPNGRYDVEVTCGGDTTVLSVNVNRGQATAGAAPGRSGALPRTGTDSSLPLARFGIVLVAAGGVALYAAKKRHDRRADFVSI